MRILLFILVFLSGISARAQTINAFVDSLKLVLANTKEDTTKAMLLSRISNEVVVVDAKEALDFAEQGIKIATKAKFNKGMALNYKNAGVAYYYLSNYPKALEYNFIALKYAEKGSKVQGITFSAVAMVYSAQKEYDKSLDYYFRALDISKKLNNGLQEASHLANIGIIYFTIGRDSLAEVYYRKALEKNREVGDTWGIANSLGNLGSVAVKQRNFNEGLALLVQWLKMSEEMGDNAGTCSANNDIGSAYLSIAMDTSGKIKPDSLVPASKKLALQRSYKHLQKALAMAKETEELQQQQEAYKNLADYYRFTGDGFKALENYEAYQKIYDSVFSKEKIKQIKSLENQHELDMKKKEIELRNKEIELNKLVVRKKRNESTFLIGGLGILLVVIFFILKERKKSEKLLLNVLPHKIAARLKKKEHPIADYFAEATIVFIDMAEFTKFAQVNPPKDTVSVLDNVFTLFDAIAEKYGLEKIKTIGDCYMAVSGLPEPRTDHATAAAKMALDVKRSMKDYTTPDGTKILFRIGLDCGSVVAGVIGKKKFIYDLWGDSVNMASRMESTGIAGEIQCTDNFKRKTESHFLFHSRGLVEIKGKGKMETWLLQGEIS